MRLFSFLFSSLVHCSLSLYLPPLPPLTFIPACVASVAFAYSSNAWLAENTEPDANVVREREREREGEAL